MKIYRVLVLPGGTEIGLEVHRSLSQAKDICLYSAAMDAPNHADCVFARHFIVPSIHQAGWMGALNRVIAEAGIDFIFPAHDDVVLALAENQAGLHARVVTSPVETCRIARFKSATYRHLKDALPVPEIYSQPESVHAYPVFLKPDRGQGSRDCHIARSEEELVCLLKQRPEYLILEYLPGEEYTIDCFSDRDLGLLFTGGRERVRIRNGISMQTRPASNPAFEDYARAIASRLEFHGAWFFQLKRDAAGVLKLLEVAPRTAGAMALHRVMGVNFPLLSLYEQERTPVGILVNDTKVELDRALLNRYRHTLTFRAVYVDLDDTLILRDRVNTRLVRFLYQCVNRGVRLVLLTRNPGSVADELKARRLKEVFDDIVCLGAGEAKADHIRERDAILIDDSFRERAAVAGQLGIPVFDLSMIEMLLDDKE